MNKRNMKKIFSFILIVIMITGSITPTFAAVTHYVVEKEGVKYQYAQKDLIESYYGDKNLYNNYISGKLQALLDDKNGYIDAENVFKYIANTEDVYVNNYTESKEAKVIEVGNLINLDSDGNAIDDETGLKVVEASFINTNTISVIFKGLDPLEIILENPLVHGQTKVTFMYEGVEYTANLNEAYIDQSQVAYVSSDFTYEGSTITGFSETGFSKFETKKSVNLPDKTKDGITITAIGPRAFMRDDFIAGTDEFTSPNGIKTLVLPSSLVEIGEEAFRYNALEGEVVFPETLEKIGNFGFFGNRITEVNLPDSVTEIGMSSFAINKIRKVDTSVNMKSIANGAFTRNLMLSEVILHEGLERIEQAAFNTSNLKEITIPSTVTYIGRDAFYGHALNSVEIPASVETVDRGAFGQRGISTLEKVILNEGLKVIGREAFANANISEVKLPYSLEKLEYRAFIGNPGVVKLYSHNPAHLSFNEQKNATTTQWFELIAVEETYVASDFNYGFMNYKPVMQPERQIFVITGFSEKGIEKSQTNGDLVIPKTVQIEKGGKHTTKSVEGIDREAFKNVSLKSVVFPETIGNYDFIINSSAFANSGLEEVVFNEGIKAIKEGAFTKNNLTKVYFPSTIVTIGNNSFAHNKINSLIFSDDVVAIQIDNYSFYDNELSEVHLPYSIFKFLKYVFKGNPGTEALLESQLHPNDSKDTGVVQLYTRNPEHLTSDTYIGLSKYHNIVNVAEKVNRTDLYSAIQNTKNIVLSDFPNKDVDIFLKELLSVKKIFKDEKSTQTDIDRSLDLLKNAVDNLMKSGNDKSSLRILIKEARVYSSQVYTPETYGLLELAIKEGEALLVDSTASDEAVKAKEEKIRKAIDSLEVRLDVSFTKDDFTYDGNKITGFSSTGEEKIKYNKNLILPNESLDGIVIEVIGEAAFQNIEPIWGSDTATPVGGIETLELPSQLKKIEDSAFKYNSLEKVDFPKTLEYIGALAFNANLIKSVYLPDSVTKLGQGVFSLNKIAELRLSPNLVEIENGAFSRNLNLTNIELHEGLTRIGQSAFIGAPIKSIKLPSTINTIESRAFSSTRLESVHIPSNIKVIEKEAFKQNAKFRTLKKVTFEEGLESIGKGAFMDGMISEVNLPYSLKELEDTAFEGNINTDKKSIIVKLHTTNESHLQFETPKSKKHQEIIFEGPLAYYALSFNVKNEAGIIVNDGRIQVNNSEGKILEDFTKVKPGEYSYVVSKEGYKDATGTTVVLNTDIVTDVILLDEEMKSDFVIDENGVIKEYKGSDTKLVIPNKVQGIVVTEIGDSVFDKKGLTSVEIPDTVITIGEYGFRGNKLKSIRLPKGLKTIKKGAFQSNELKSLDVPSSVDIIGNIAFSKNKIEKLNLPEGLKTIEDRAFQGNSLEELRIPGSVEVVAAYSFAVNPNLSSLILQEGIKEISVNAFNNDKSLKGEIILPSTLEHLYTSAFKVTGVTSLYIKGDENSSSIEIHSGISPNLEDIKFESPYKRAYIVFNPSGDVEVDLGTIDYSGEVDDLQTYLKEKLLVKESAYHVNKQDNTGKSDIMVSVDIDWNLEDIDLSSGLLVIYGTAKDFTVEDLENKGKNFTPPNPSGAGSKNIYKITINPMS